MIRTIASALVALGLFTRVAAGFCAFTMVIAAFIAHGDDPWVGKPPSKELALVYLVVFVALIFLGAGKWSVDGMWRKKDSS